MKRCSFDFGITLALLCMWTSNCAVQMRNEEEQEEESDLITMSEEETKMLESLTWRPLAEDTLLYAVVVVAPYNIMQKFKYKVKLTPGTGKRGKAAKSAIALFQV